MGFTVVWSCFEWKYIEKCLFYDLGLQMGLQMGLQNIGIKTVIEGYIFSFIYGVMLEICVLHDS